MEPLNLLNLPLCGAHLIEAGAGTGKTYTIAGLYVRLTVESGISPESILVVTFTKAATEELKERIRRRLREARQGAITGITNDLFLDRLIQQSGDRSLAIQRLEEALAGFDRAAICTIHGFCHRVLRDHAFETGLPFDMELVSDPVPMMTDVAADFWREQVYLGPPELAGYMLDQTKGPSFFARLMKASHRPAVTVIPEPLRPRLDHLKAFRRWYADLRDAWPGAREAVTEHLLTPSLKGNIYGSLRPVSATPDTTPRRLRVNTLITAMDLFTASDNPVWPIPPAFEKFTADKIAASTRKNHMAPIHGFFQLCQDLWQSSRDLGDELEAYRRYLKVACIPYARANIRKKKERTNILFYDDLLTRLQAVLLRKQAGGDTSLADRVGRQYRAALVDEFQDTDLVQYSIFSKLFETSDTLLCMIGDPKQAIYGFRGADIYSYLSAARQSDGKHTLTSNWRSSAGLIDAVNTLFSNVDDPFVFQDISFVPGRPAHKRIAGPFPDTPSLKLWLLPHAPGKPLGKGEAVNLVARTIAGESSRLIDSGVPAGDMAVLVRTNRQARIVKSFLTQWRVPAVLVNAGNIFEAEEAGEMLRLLSGILEPDRLSLLRGAVATIMMGGAGTDFAAELADPDAWDRRAAAFGDYRRIWSEYGFIQMFQHAMARERIRERLLRLPDGERRLTNTLHLAEILHRESVERHLGVKGILKWLGGQIQMASRSREEYQLRLESDAHAVRIVTVHGSKGLEFPIVFCPFMWGGADVRDDGVLFHDPANDFRLTLDLGSKAMEAHRRAARNEALAENLRLLYVGLTRAIYRCYTAWGRVHRAETAALAYLIHGRGLPRGSAPLEALSAHMGEITEKHFFKDIELLVQRSDGNIAAEPIPLPEAPKPGVDRGESLHLSRRSFQATIDRSWHITSYTGLMRHGGERERDFPASHFPDHDVLSTVVRPGGWHPSSVRGGKRDIGDFPPGARAGAFFHDILEHLDFASRDRGAMMDLVAKKLSTHGFGPVWENAVLGTLEIVIDGSLEEGITLSSVSADNRVSEMEFYFPLNPITPKGMARLFSRHNGPEAPDGFSTATGRLDFSPSRGVMKGFMDLVFRAGDRFYLVDWKSNRLGATFDAYDPVAIARTMAAENYYLQYHLYVMALHLYLQQRIPSYQYESHFGAVYYVFLRGLDPRRETTWGVFRDRPARDLIDAMVDTLVSKN